MGCKIKKRDELDFLIIHAHPRLIGCIKGMKREGFPKQP